MSWENQYMHLVGTKPDLIVSDPDRLLTENTRETLLSKKRQFSKLFVELGSGSGMHLLRLASDNPDTLCVGFEIRYKRAFRTAEKAERGLLNNLLVLRSDAKNLSELFNPAEVDAYFVNYPDPWAKRRWLKNRLLNPPLLANMLTTLKPSGYLRYKTDHREYFESTKPLIEAPVQATVSGRVVPDATSRWVITKSTTDLLNSEFAAANVPTEFEQLFMSQGKCLCMLEAQKTPI